MAGQCPVTVAFVKDSRRWEEWGEGRGRREETRPSCDEADPLYKPFRAHVVGNRLYGCLRPVLTQRAGRCPLVSPGPCFLRVSKWD